MTSKRPSSESDEVKVFLQTYLDYLDVNVAMELLSLFGQVYGCFWIMLFLSIRGVTLCHVCCVSCVVLRKEGRKEGLSFDVHSNSNYNRMTTQKAL